ncbi:MAG: hypothetical protein ACFFCO_03045 [Promethearchaeota archaeon]
MSEFLLLSVYTRYLESKGYDVRRRVKLEKGSGSVDIMARRKGRKTILAEARWIRTEGDVYEALARCMRNRRAYPRMRHILVLEKNATSAEIEQVVLDRCYEHQIELNHVDINNRQVFENILTTHLFPALRSVVKSTKKVLKEKLSAPQKELLLNVLGPLIGIEGLPSLSSEIESLIRRIKT